MKVLFLNFHHDPAVSGGGAEVTLRHLTQGLLRKGIEPIMLVVGTEPGIHQSTHNGIKILSAGLRNIYWPQAKNQPHPLKRTLWHVLDSHNLAMQLLLRQVLEAELPDAVSVHNLAGWSAAAWSTIARSGIPAVQVLHDMYSICPKSTMRTTHGNCLTQCISCRLLRMPHRRTSRNLSAVVGVSQFILDRHLMQGYFRDVSIQHVIHNARDAKLLGIDTINVRDSGNSVRIGYIGQLNPSKGVELLLQAFTSAAIPGAELWIAGTGNADYTQWLRTRWASSQVRFLGRVTQSEFYQCVDMVVVPSLWQEPLGMVVAEGMAFGKPVIGSRRGGIPEMIRDGKNGLLFEPDNPNELVEAMRRLSWDEELRAKMGRDARISAQPFLDIDAWIGRYVNIYQEISQATA